jgi:hypothetical protein
MVDYPLTDLKALNAATVSKSRIGSTTGAETQSKKSHECRISMDRCSSDDSDLS